MAADTDVPGEAGQHVSENTQRAFLFGFKEVHCFTRFTDKSYWWFQIVHGKNYPILFLAQLPSSGIKRQMPESRSRESGLGSDPKDITFRKAFTLLSRYQEFSPGNAKAVCSQTSAEQGWL